jgi:hypothetical protein
MKDWIASTMKCRVCVAGVKATYISKTTVGIIASQLSSTRTEKCSAIKPQLRVVLRIHATTGLASVTRFAANWRLLAATQLLESQKVGKTIPRPAPRFAAPGGKWRKSLPPNTSTYRVKS